MDIRDSAASLADEIEAGLKDGRPLEWIEQVIGNAFVDLLRSERQQCTQIAESRATMWKDACERYKSGSWPSEALTEARERRKEAQIIADAIASQPVAGGFRILEQQSNEEL